MPDFRTEIDIDPEEFLCECSANEIDQIVLWLKSHGYLNDSSQISEISVAESEYESAISKLHSKWNSLTEDEERTIKNIAKRFF